MSYLNRCLFLILLLIPFASCNIGQGTPREAIESPTSISLNPDIYKTPTYAFPLTLIDSNGRQITLVKPPQRIVLLDSDSVEILFALGEGDRIIGTHSFVDYPPETIKIERVGDAFSLNLERVVQLEPDLVYTFFERFVPDMEALGLKVLYLESLNSTLQDVMNHFTLWGRITGNPEGAAKLTETFQTRLSILTNRLNRLDRRPRVYHHTIDFWTPGGDTLIGQIYRILQTDLISDDISGYVQLSPEEIIAKTPDVIVTNVESLDEVLNSSALQHTPAVQNGRVIVLARGSFSVAGPRLISAIEQLAISLHPDLFSDGSQ